MNPHYHPQQPMPPHPQPMISELAGPPSHQCTYGHHNVPAMIPSNNYYQQNSAPPMQPPTLPIQPRMPGPRDHIAAMSPTDPPPPKTTAAVKPVEDAASTPQDFYGTDHEGFTYRYVSGMLRAALLRGGRLASCELRRGKKGSQG